MDASKSYSITFGAEARDGWGILVLVKVILCQSETVGCFTSRLDAKTSRRRRIQHAMVRGFNPAPTPL
jgi:hypothetical protein